MPFTDNFNNEGSEVDLASHTPSGGGAWTRVDGSANYLTVISAGWAINNTSDSDGALYQCTSQGSSAHYCQYVTKEVASGTMFVANRATDRSNYVGIRCRNGVVEIFKRVSGSFTSLGATSASVAEGNTVRFESSSGNVHTIKINGTQAHQVTDSFNSAEVRQGLVARGAGRLSWLDDYEAGALGGGGAPQDLFASGSASASGTATPAATVSLAGVGVSLAGGSASIAIGGSLAAAGSSASAGAAQQSVAIALSALGLTVASGTAALSSSGSGSLAASGAATADGSAATVANVTISASGLAQAAAQAGVSASVLLAGAGAAAASGNAALAVQLQALAAGAAQASGSATISGSAAGELSAYGQAAASGAALLTLDVRIAAAGSAAADGSAALSSGSAAQIAAAGGATASGDGTVSAQVTLTGAGFVQAMGAGVLNVQIPLQAIGAAISVGTASLSELPDVLPRVASPYRTWRVRAHNRTLRIRA